MNLNVHVPSSLQSLYLYIKVYMVIELIESNFRFFGCRPTFKKIIKAKSVQEYKPDPYVATVLNCAMWSFYGMPFVTSDDILVLTINGAGLVLQIAYVTIYIIYSSWPTRVFIDTTTD